MIAFNDTKIAFISKTDYELKRAKFLFSTISSPTLVNISTKMVNTALAIHFPITWAVKPTIYAHFCGGLTIDDCNKAVELLGKHKVKSILDYSVEGKDNIEDINNALKETLYAIKNAGENIDIPFAVFKPTAFTRHEILIKMSENNLSASEKKEADDFVERIDILCKAAFDNNIPILIDAEDYAFQIAIDQIVELMMQKYNKEKAIVFNTLQMYRWDRLEFLKEAYKKAENENYFLGMKFVRGAYMEKERAKAQAESYKSPIQETKDDTDRDYNAALKFCIEHLDKISIFNGTHNELSNSYLAELMEEKGIAKNDDRIWFSQLFGMSDNISFKLGELGYNVAKYVPYGPVKHVMPYLLRRAQENTSVKGQTGRELNLILLEQKRRSSEKNNL